MLVDQPQVAWLRLALHPDAARPRRQTIAVNPERHLFPVIMTASLLSPPRMCGPWGTGFGVPSEPQPSGDLPLTTAEREKTHLGSVPHGGSLVDRIVDSDRAEALRASAADMAAQELTERELSDVEMLAIGAY